MVPPVIAGYYPVIAEPHINQRLIRRTGRERKYNICSDGYAQKKQHRVAVVYCDGGETVCTEIS